MPSASARFAFGENWSRYLETLDDSRIAEAEASLRTMLGVPDLTGKRFLDVGSGSGLFSLAARRLGATVRSFDYDPQSVACTTELKRRYFPDDRDWIVGEGSVLDRDYMAALGPFDVVYAWGVLHHTGAMWDALATVDGNVAPGGSLFVALYADQGVLSRIWRAIKKAYVALPSALRWIILGPAYVVLWGPATIRDVVTLRPFATWRAYARKRGMSPHTDVVDWVGGYPYEVATPEQVRDFYAGRGYALKTLNRAAGHGCHEYVFVKENPET